MIKHLMKIAFLSLLALAPVSAVADVDVRVNINIPLPPPIIFPAPPEVIVIPETYVYTVPDVDVDIFFFEGWWWRPWQGRWYRSRYHDRGWGYYQYGVPAFYSRVPPGWRAYYKDRRWKGYRWEYRRIPYGYAERNWDDWQKTRHWEKDRAWGVRGLEKRYPKGKWEEPRRDSRSRDRSPDSRYDQRGPRKGGGPDRGSRNYDEDRRRP